LVSPKLLKGMDCNFTYLFEIIIGGQYARPITLNMTFNRIVTLFEHKKFYIIHLQALRIVKSTVLPTALVMLCKYFSGVFK
jgi:hypothetical protein